MSARKPPGAIDGESGRFRVFCGDRVFFVRVAQKQQHQQSWFCVVVKVVVFGKKDERVGNRR